MKKIVRSVIITCMLFMAFCNICYAATFQPTITAETGSVGDTITVTVSLPANTNAAGGSFNLIYDNTKMELVDAVAGNIITAFSKTVNKTYAANKVRLNFAGSETVSASGGVILTATFRLTASGTATFSTEKFKLADIDTNYLTCADSTKNISITSGGTSSAFTPTITAENGTVGDTINVTVSIPANTNAAGGSFNLIYDNTKMELVDATAGDIISAFSKTVNKTYAANKVRLNFAGSETVSASGGVILKASFKLTAAGTASFSTEKFKLADIDTNYLTCADTSKSITISGESTPVEFSKILLENVSYTFCEDEKMIEWNEGSIGAMCVAATVTGPDNAVQMFISTWGPDISEWSESDIRENAIEMAKIWKEELGEYQGEDTVPYDIEQMHPVYEDDLGKYNEVLLIGLDENYDVVGYAIVGGTIPSETKPSDDIHVTGVKLNKTSTTLTVGDTEELTATVLPSNATNKNVTWASSNTSVATVDNGVVTAVGAGTATITVTTEQWSYVADCTVTVTSIIDENSPVIKVNNSKGYIGKTVDVVINVENNPGIAILGFNVNYDKNAMILKSATLGEIFTGELECNTASVPFVFNVYSGSENKTNDGKLVTLQFEIKSDCTEGDYAISLSDIEALNIAENDVFFETVNGTITVANSIPGDVTGDGKVTRADLLRLAKSFSGFEVEMDMAAADVTADGKVTRADLLRLAKHFSGFDVELGK